MQQAYSYIRFSTPEQAKGDSYRRQSEAADEWARKNDYEIVDTLRDLGKSAYRGKNLKEGPLADFLEAVKDGRIPKNTILIIESLDRFSRDEVVDVLPRFIDLITGGLNIVTLANGCLFTNELIRKDTMQLIGSLVVMMRSHEESKLKGTRVADAWAKKRVRAREDREKITDRVPAWLKVVSEGRGHSKKRSFVVDEERAAIIRRIFEETVQGHGRRAIAKRLNREFRDGFNQCRSFGSKGWQPSYVAKILGGRAVLGEYQPHRRNKDGEREADGDEIKNYYPAIIDEALWRGAKVARLRRRTGNDAGRPQMEAVNLLGGLARCACGKRMAFINKGQPPKGGRYYVCSHADRDAGCGNGRLWKWETVEKAILFHLDNAALEHAFEPNNEPVGQSTEYYNERVRELAKKLERALDFLAENTDLKNDPTVGGRVRHWKNELDAAKAERDTAARAEMTRPDLERAKENWATALNFAKKIKSAQGQELVVLRQQMILQFQSMFAEVRFSGLEIHVSIEVPKRPSEIIGSPIRPAPFEEKTVDGIERYYLLYMIYSEDPGLLARLGVPRSPGEGIFVSSFAKVS